MSNSTATAPIKDDASKTVSNVSGSSDVKKDEPTKAVPATNSDKK